MEPEDQKPTQTYDAFISYSRKDAAFASKLKKSLEDYTPPADLKVPQRRLNIFLDKEDFTGTEYQRSLGKHLKYSAKMLVICSPNSRNSWYVNDEIRRFAKTTGTENIVPILLSGIPNNEARSGQEVEMAFPDALCEVMAMPLAAEYRGFQAQHDEFHKGKFEGSWYTTLSNIYGINRSELEQRDKKRQARIRNRWISGLSVVSVILAGLTIWALISRKEAVEQRQVAEKRQKLALSRQLAVQAVTHLDGKLDLAMLLSVQAYLTYNTGEAYGSLLAALEHSPNLTTYLSHSVGNMGSMAFSPDRRTLAVGNCVRDAISKSCAQGKVVLLDTNTYQSLSPTLIAHSAGITGLAFSPNGKMLASVGEDGEIMLWDLNKRQLSGESLFKHTKGLACVAFSPDGKMLASGTMDGTVFLWELGTQQPARRLKESGSPVWSVAFSPASKLLASGGDDNFVVLWDVEAGESQGTRLVHGDHVRTVAFYASPDGERVLSSSLDTAISVWDAKSRQVAYPKFGGHTEYVESVAFSQDGKLLALADKDATLILLDIENRAELNLPLAERVENNIVGNSLRQESWEMSRLRPFSGHTTAPNRLTFSDDGSLLASAGRDGVIILWNTAQMSPLVQSLPTNKAKEQDTPAIRSECKRQDGEQECSMSPDGKIMARIMFTSIRCAAGAEEKACVDVGIRLWDTATGFPIGPTLRSLERRFRGEDFHIEFTANHKVRVLSSETESMLEWSIDPTDLQGRACIIANRNLTQDEWNQYLGDEAYRKTCPNLP